MLAVLMKLITFALLGPPNGWSPESLNFCPACETYWIDILLGALEQNTEGKRPREWIKYRTRAVKKSFFSLLNITFIT